VLFREYLRGHAHARGIYANVKQEVAKTAVILDLLDAAEGGAVGIDPTTTMREGHDLPLFRRSITREHLPGKGANGPAHAHRRC
jgi:hypothetical protein